MRIIYDRYENVVLYNIEKNKKLAVMMIEARVHIIECMVTIKYIFQYKYAYWL